MRVFLVGFMGSGKSSVAPLLAERLSAPLIDLDAEVERRAGRTVADIFAEEGEEAFRALEREALAQAASGPEAVVDCGGGVVLDERNRRLMRSSGYVVHLKVTAQEAARRVGAEGGRPLLDGPDAARRAEDLLAARQDAYSQAADVVVDTTGREPVEVAEELAERLAERRVPGSFELEVRVREPYMVRVGPGLLASLGDRVREVSAADQVAVVTDETVWGLYGERVEESLSRAGLRFVKAVVPPGEESKNWERAGRVLSELVRSGLDREGLVLALGGGVIGDLAGFCASVYMRGVPFLQVPTTLLAQVDSAIGGKTGVDLPAGKNLAGTFWQPSGVVSDIDCLQTLHESEWRSGLAEVAKSALLAGEAATSALEGDLRPLAAREPGAVLRAVEMSVELKARVVSADETETGGREQLNFGHTFGHAVEKVIGYGRIPHGHAVAEGMRFAATLAVRTGVAGETLRRRIDNLLDGLGLPALDLRPDADAMIAAIRTDKKNRGRRIRFVLMSVPGEWELHTVDEGLLAELLTAGPRGSEGKP